MLQDFKMKNFSENTKWAGVLITGKKMTSSQTLDVMMKLDLSLRSGLLTVNFSNLRKIQ